MAGAYSERMATAPRAEEPQVDVPDDPIHESAPDAASATDDDLRDTALHEEIELVGQLVVAATSTPHRLSAQEIDRVLGVEHDD
jgi:hypothetical protein